MGSDFEKLAAALSPNPFRQILVFAGLGDKARTFDALVRMADLVGPERVGMYLNYPELAFIRGYPQVKALRKTIGLPD